MNASMYVLYDVLYDVQYDVQHDVQYDVQYDVQSLAANFDHARGGAQNSAHDASDKNLRQDVAAQLHLFRSDFIDGGTLDQHIHELVCNFIALLSGLSLRDLD